MNIVGLIGLLCLLYWSHLYAYRKGREHELDISMRNYLFGRDHE